MKKILNFLSLLIPLAVALASLFAASFMAVMVYYQIYFSSGILIGSVFRNKNITLAKLMHNMPFLPDSFVSTLTFSMPLIWVVIFALWYWQLTRNEKVEPVKVFTFKNIIILALLSLGYQLATTGLVELILPYFDKLSEEYSKIMEQLEYASPWLTLFSTVILAPISEELIFRGVVFKMASRFTSFTVANITQALFFGLFHMNIVQGLYAFAGGLAMGYVAYKYRTIIASIIFHLFFNGISYILVAPPNNMVMVIYTIIGILLSAIALLQIRKVGNRQKVYIPELDQTADWKK
ncbi:MAG TPA: type II CAAX endopeptidase family protein [Mobilitalea sp.]|nr:type II CAAX endopeptidase family protein [Mobilitalea sp.]